MKKQTVRWHKALRCRAAAVPLQLQLSLLPSVAGAEPDCACQCVMRVEMDA